MTKETDIKTKEKNKFDNEETKLFLIYTIIGIIALIARASFISFESGDYTWFLKPWFNGLKERGGMSGVKSFTGDYEPLYVTILALLTYFPISSLFSIKIVSIIGDYILAFSSAKLVGILAKDRKNAEKLKIITYTIILFLPNVLINASMWAQCDSIYSAFIILAFCDLFERKYNRMFAFLGIALAFKLQTILILPLFVTMYFVRKDFHWYQFLIIPAMLVICAIPAMCFGMPFSKIFTCFFTQVSEYSEYITLNFPSIFNLFSLKKIPFNSVLFLKVEWVLITLLVDLFIFIFTLKNKERLNNENIILLAIVFLTVETFLLPKMHERYLFVGEILSVIYAITYLKNFIPAIWLNFQALILYLIVLNYDFDMWYLSFNRRFKYRNSLLVLMTLIFAMVTLYYLIHYIGKMDKKKPIKDINLKIKSKKKIIE